MTTTTSTKALVRTAPRCARCNAILFWCNCDSRHEEPVMEPITSTPAKVTVTRLSHSTTRVSLRCEHSKTMFTFRPGLPMDEGDKVWHVVQLALEQSPCACLQVLKEEQKRDEEW